MVRPVFICRGETTVSPEGQVNLGQERTKCDGSIAQLLSGGIRRWSSVGKIWYDDDDDDEDSELRSKERQIDGDPMGLGGNHGEASLECGLGQQCGLWAN